jgi:chemotaxis response regulator CheB
VTASMSGPRQNEDKTAAFDRLREVRANAVNMRERLIVQRARIARAARYHSSEAAHAHRHESRALSLDVRPLATRLISLGGSAGAMAAVIRIMAALPRDCPAAVAIAIHGVEWDERLDVCRRFSPWPVRHVLSKETLREGVVYVPPACGHLVVHPDRRLTTSWTGQPHFRPSVDWLFRSAAAAFRERHVAVVLSGRLNDGVDGSRAVIRCGGTVYAQDPASCSHSDMPRAAISAGCISQVLPIAELAVAIAQATMSTAADDAAWLEPFGS